ncbi:hypothetical protein, partial [Acidiphilium sp. MT5]
MDHIEHALDNGCPARDQFNLRAELLPLDDLAASILLTSGQQVSVVSLTLLKDACSATMRRL